MRSTPTNLDMGIPMVYLDSENIVFLKKVDFWAGFLGLTFLTFWSYDRYRAQNGDSRMIWYFSIRDLMDKLWMDEVWIFETSFIDCE